MAVKTAAKSAQRASAGERSVTLLGATGSIGASTIDLIKRERARYRVEAVTANGKAVALAALARATGGDLFVASTEAQITAAVGRVLDELRHQYVFAFNGSDAIGVHPIEIRTRQPKMRVTSRKWYRSGSGD